MDAWNSLLQLALSLAVLVLSPVLILLLHRIIGLLRDKFHLQVSQDEEDLADKAVATGVGLLRTKLATGAMSLSDVQLGNVHVDQAAQSALNIIYATVEASPITKEEVAAKLVGALGHALGDDPSVPSVAGVTAASTPTPAVAVTSAPAA